MVGVICHVDHCEPETLDTGGLKGAGVLFDLTDSCFVVEWLLVKEFYFSYWYRWMEMVLLTAPGALLVWLGYKKEGILGDVIQALPISLLCFVGSHIVSCLFKIHLFICLRSCFVLFCSSLILVLCIKREVNRSLALFLRFYW